MQIIECVGQELRPYVQEVAKLRMTVFHDYPYLYDGLLEQELGYLESSIQAKRSYTVLLKNDTEFMGISTAIPMHEAKPHFSQAFKDAGYALEQMVYFGESVLLPQYRGQGLGHLFFDYREAFAQKIIDDLRYTTFCSVDRPDDHPLKPKNYQDHRVFWNKRGYLKHPQLKARFAWKDRDEVCATDKHLSYWLKAW